MALASAPSTTRPTAVHVTAGEDLAAVVAAAPPNSRVVLETGATFDVAAPIVTSTNGLVIDGQGASVRIGSRPTGDTATFDHMFVLTGADQSIENVHFTQRTNGINSARALAVNVRLDGKRGTIRNCTFNTGSTLAVGVMDPDAEDNKILDNYLNGSGITYSWFGSSRTVVARNIIDDAPKNALSGLGNGKKSNDDCSVLDNTINNAGRMGIEDWNTTQRTIIRGNKINKTADIGISAVGRGPVVEGNTIIDPTYDGIETNSNGSLICGNTVVWTQARAGTRNGIIIDGNASTVQTGAAVSDNALHNCAVGINVWNTLTVVTITGNVITDATTHGMSLETPVEGITCSGNTLRFNVPGNAASGVRMGIVAGAKAVNLVGNAIAYTATSAGTATDIAIKPIADGVVIVGNAVHGGGRADANRPRITPFGAAPANVLIANNSLLAGATLDTAGLVRPTVTNNVTG